MLGPSLRMKKNMRVHNNVYVKNSQIYYLMCTKYKVHMFSVGTTTMQSLNIKE